MTYTVYSQSNPFAELSCEPLGLYCRLRCRCPKPPQNYLFVQDGASAPVFLGTFVPDGANWYFQKTLPQKNLPLSDRLRFFLASKERPAAEHGQILTENGKCYLQLPYEKTKPFPLFSKIRFFSLIEQNGSLFWRCGLGGQKMPVFVDNATNCDTINEVS